MDKRECPKVCASEQVKATQSDCFTVGQFSACGCSGTTRGELMLNLQTSKLLGFFQKNKNKKLSKSVTVYGE